MGIVKNLPLFNDQGLASFYFEANIIILEIIDNSGFWGKFEEEGRFPKSQIVIKVEGMKIPLKEGDKVKVIVKYERDKKQCITSPV